MKKPLIGTTLRCENPSAKRKYPTAQAFEYNHLRWANVIFDNGGYPIYLSSVSNDSEVAAELEFLDGFLLSGGEDVEPSFYGCRREPGCGPSSPLRDAFEIHLVKMALRKHIPLLGVCRGMQVINVAMGGTLHQDIAALGTETMNHLNTETSDYGRFHNIMIALRSSLSKVMGESVISVNTSHHQAVDKIGSGLEIISRTEDGIIEGIDYTGNNYLLGVQWHPEAMPEARSTKLLIGDFIKACRIR